MFMKVVVGFEGGDGSRKATWHKFVEPGLGTMKEIVRGGQGGGGVAVPAERVPSH